VSGFKRAHDAALIHIYEICKNMYKLLVCNKAGKCDRRGVAAQFLRQINVRRDYLFRAIIRRASMPYTICFDKISNCFRLDEHIDCQTPCAERQWIFVKIVQSPFHAAGLVVVERRPEMFCPRFRPSTQLLPFADPNVIAPGPETMCWVSANNIFLTPIPETDAGSDPRDVMGEMLLITANDFANRRESLKHLPYVQSLMRIELLRSWFCETFTATLFEKFADNVLRFMDADADRRCILQIYYAIYMQAPNVFISLISLRSSEIIYMYALLYVLESSGKCTDVEHPVNESKRCSMVRSALVFNVPRRIDALWLNDSPHAPMLDCISVSLTARPNFICSDNGLCPRGTCMRTKAATILALRHSNTEPVISGVQRKKINTACLREEDLFRV
jgi:hypothetical protein